MSLFFSNKAVRLLLSLSVSIWMAGACLFGCSNTTIAAEPIAKTEESVKSCHGHMMRSHGGGASFEPIPRGMMNDCPLVTNATAATLKSNANVPDPGRASVAVLPQLQKQTQLVNNALVIPFLPNRGPTHLLCCVFLI